MPASARRGKIEPRQSWTGFGEKLLYCGPSTAIWRCRLDRVYRQTQVAAHPMTHRRFLAIFIPPWLCAAAGRDLKLPARPRKPLDVDPGPAWRGPAVVR